VDLEVDDAKRSTQDKHDGRRSPKLRLVLRVVAQHKRVDDQKREDGIEIDEVPFVHPWY